MSIRKDPLRLQRLERAQTDREVALHTSQSGETPGLVDRPEHWAWSSFRAYSYGEVGAVRVNHQEWATEIKPRPVEKFNEKSRPQHPLIRQRRE